MKILHILNDGHEEDLTEILLIQSRTDKVEVFDLTDMNVSYEELVDKIERCDKVISW